MEKLPIDSNFEFKIFFSYGYENTYTQLVRQKAQQNQQIQVIDEFLKPQAFQELYKKTAAFVFNGYRQMAMGNISTAIIYGVKVYLSEKNITYNWLLKQNIQVYSIEKDLDRDLINDDILLNKIVVDNNRNQLELLMNKYNLKSFQNSLLNILEQD